MHIGVNEDNDVAWTQSRKPVLDCVYHLVQRAEIVLGNVKNDDRDRTSAHVLLETHAPINRDHNGKSLGLRSGKKFAVGEALPTESTAVDRHERGERSLERPRNAVVKQDPQRTASSSKASRALRFSQSRTGWTISGVRLG